MTCFDYSGLHVIPPSALVTRVTDLVHYVKVPIMSKIKGMEEIPPVLTISNRNKSHVFFVIWF